MSILRPYQSDAILRVKKSMVAGHKRVCLVLPTGTGKTVVGTSMVQGAVAKGSRVLWLAHRTTDHSKLDKQRAELDRAQARREQVEMMIAWSKELESQEDLVADAAYEVWVSHARANLEERDFDILRRICAKYPLEEVRQAIPAALSTYPDRLVALDRLEGVIRTRRISKEKPYIRDLLYIRGILKKRCPDFDTFAGDWIEFLERAHLAGVSLKQLKELAIAATRAFHFQMDVETTAQHNEEAK